MSPNGKRPVYRFSHFEVDLRDLELRKRGVRIRLQGQPFRLLEALLENPAQSRHSRSESARTPQSSAW
jgi:DNA-binding response OmpR family regulator